MTPEDLRATEQPRKKTNNVVILGAGASVATLNALGLPAPSAMDNFIENARLGNILTGVRLHTSSNNLEDIYSELYDRPEYKEKMVELEEAIYQYMASFKLPAAKVSFYDLLFLCSRHDDCIATFNWDGLLFQAYYRVAAWLETWGIRNPFRLLPIPVFLHGNVGVGICLKHHQVGENGQNCPQCEKPLGKTPLLYPIRHKDYGSNEYIQDAWVRLKRNLRYSHFLTIFGYGAPKSDQEILEVFKEEFGDQTQKNNSRMEIVDIKRSDELQKTWGNLIGLNKFSCMQKITETAFLRHPQQAEPIDDYPQNMTLTDAKEIFLPRWIKYSSTEGATL